MIIVGDFNEKRPRLETKKKSKKHSDSFAYNNKCTLETFEKRARDQFLKILKNART